MGMAQEWDSVEGKDKGLTAEELDNKIHELTATEIMTQLEAGDASPGLLQCALRFLKDNDITALPVPGSAMKRISEKLSLPFPRIADAGDEAESPRSRD